MPCLSYPVLLRPVLSCPALPRPTLPCLAMPCPALQLIWQAVWTFVIPYILASAIKGLLYRFFKIWTSSDCGGQTRHWSSEIRPYTSALVLHVLAASGVFKGATELCLFWPRNQFLTKENIGKHDLPSLFIYLKKFPSIQMLTQIDFS